MMAMQHRGRPRTPYTPLTGAYVSAQGPGRSRPVCVNVEGEGIAREKRGSLKSA
jgi:hypothetical protein